MIKAAAGAAFSRTNTSRQVLTNCWKILFFGHLSTRIKDAGIAIRHSQERILFYTAGSRNGFQGMEAVCRHTKKHKTISKRHFFVTEKSFEDARQDEKHVPDLLESIIQPPGLVKEELRPILFKMTQIRSKIKKIRVSTFWIPEVRSFPAEGQRQPPRKSVLCNIWSR